MPKIICISGKAQHGKDTLAIQLKSHLEIFSKRVLIIHNADLLKFLCTQLFGWDGVKDDRGRMLLQYIGTEIVRRKEPDFWVDFIIKLIRLFGDDWDYVLIPDCRFPNEIEQFVKQGFPTLHVRVIRENGNSGISAELSAHESEISLDNTIPDFTFENNSTISDLLHQTTTLLLKHQRFFDDISNRSLGLQIIRSTE